MGHGFEPGCKCSNCKRTGKRRLREWEREERGSGSGTMSSSVFRSVPQRSNPNIINHYFNSSGDGSSHGHIKQEELPDGSIKYHYARDVEGDEYEL
jgi:hypothetical protein